MHYVLKLEADFDERKALRCRDTRRQINGAKDLTALVSRCWRRFRCR